MKAYGTCLLKLTFVRLLIAFNVEAGEEIFMSYGPHPNDFLFTECEASVTHNSSFLFADFGRWILPRRKRFRSIILG